MAEKFSMFKNFMLICDEIQDNGVRVDKDILITAMESVYADNKKAYDEMVRAEVNIRKVADDMGFGTGGYDTGRAIAYLTLLSMRDETEESIKEGVRWVSEYLKN